MATICTLYLTFNCFSPSILDDKLLECVLRGDFAFQEYAVCNWLHHLKYFLQGAEIDTPASSSLRMAFMVLNDRHKDQPASLSQSDVLSEMDLSNMLNKLLVLYDDNCTILTEDSDLRKTTLF